MKSIFKKIKNMIPYILLVAVYFFFVNLEARKSQNGHSEQIRSQKDEKSLNSSNDNIITIKIPVMPYKQK
tara:strand:+ start:275 stop:484 length:210 start_codon:yes stop_codon:yes gene_type:complete